MSFLFLRNLFYLTQMTNTLLRNIFYFLWHNNTPPMFDSAFVFHCLSWREYIIHVLRRGLFSHDIL